MIVLLVSIFIIGYTAIAIEHIIHIDKAATALIMGTICWAIIALWPGSNISYTETALMHHLSEIAGILFFILGAMTIVEIIDSHDGFDIITNAIKTDSKQKLLWIIGILAFFLSSLLDNLTTAIVMISIVRKIVPEVTDKWKFGGIIIICANAGGAFSPLGDVTTTMLWVNNQVTAYNIIVKLFLPSLTCALVPLIIMHFQFGKQTLEKIVQNNKSINNVSEQKVIFYAGLILLIMVPVFKTITHLPPFMGMLLAVGMLWLITAFLHKSKKEEQKIKFSVANALQKIDTPSILFFMGILLTVAALQTTGILQNAASLLSTNLKNEVNITLALGGLSAIVDNVPLVAAAQGMYSLQQYPTDHNFWELLALTTGTGGSMIIIGSAAGVALMGIEKIPFIWYLKNIAWIAAIGFLLGVLTFVLVN